MAAYITEDCINCDACLAQCPTQAISEGEEIYFIDPALCTECVGSYSYFACQAVCPPVCCLPNPHIPETESVLVDRALRLLPDDSDLRRNVETNRYPSRFRT